MDYFTFKEKLAVEAAELLTQLMSLPPPSLLPSIPNLCSRIVVLVTDIDIQEFCFLLFKQRYAWLSIYRVIVN